MLVNLCFKELCNVLNPNKRAPALKKINIKLKIVPPSDKKLILEIEE